MDKHERIASWWIHWPDLQWPDSENLDRIKARAEGLAKANVSAAMLFGTHFRWDWLPVFPLLHDYIATVAEELHKYGVKRCYYGHLHGASIASAIEGDVDGIRYKLVSADGLRFCPLKIQ